MTDSSVETAPLDEQVPAYGGQNGGEYGAGQAAKHMAPRVPDGLVDDVDATTGEDAAEDRPEPAEVVEVRPAAEAATDESASHTGETAVDDHTMRRALEAILIVADEPLPEPTLAQLVGRPTPDVAEALRGLADAYAADDRGFELRPVAGGWRFYSHPELAPYVETFVRDGQQARLTQAALETLAVVAYRQPVSRGRVSAIRGVNVDGVMRTLETRGLVEQAGTDTESQATLYRTTSLFLEKMGMGALDELPELAPYLPAIDDLDEPETPVAPASPVEVTDEQIDEFDEPNETSEIDIADADADR